MSELEVQDNEFDVQELEIPPSGVYVRVNSQNSIVDVNSDNFITPDDSWIKIDEGYGDKYCLAQGNYFPTPITNMDGTFNYKLVNGKPVARSDYDKAPEDQERANYIEADALQRKLDETDYVVIKIAEGVSTKEEYEEILSMRDQWRRRLGELKTMKLIGR